MSIKVWYHWLLQQFAPATYEDGRRYALEQIQCGKTLEELEYEFDTCAGFNGYTPFDRGFQSVLREAYHTLSPKEKHSLHECTGKQVDCLPLSRQEAVELVETIDQGIRILIAYQHMQEIEATDVKWFNEKCDTLLGIKNRIKEHINV